MLNAFRHHRNSHDDLDNALGGMLTCSTPFGIIGILTRAAVACREEKRCVLNAFRHHRNSHASMIGPVALSLSAQRLSASSEFSHTELGWLDGDAECSTPFGIIGILTSPA